MKLKGVVFCVQVNLKCVCPLKNCTSVDYYANAITYVKANSN